MSEFNRWLTSKYPEYLLEQEGAPMQQPPPAQTAAERLRQRLEKSKENKIPDQKIPDQADKVRQYLQSKQGTGGIPSNTSNEIKPGFNKEYGEYLRKMGERNNDDECIRILSNYIRWTSIELDKLNKKGDQYSELGVYGYGFPDNLVEDWVINYNSILTPFKLYYAVDRKQIIQIIIQNENKGNPVEENKKNYYNFLLENPQIIDKFISEIYKEVKKLENSSQRGQICVKEALKIEKYKTDRLLDLKNKIIKIKGNSLDISRQGMK